MEGRLKRLRSRARRRFDRFEPARILPFRGHGTATQAFVEGRVLERHRSQGSREVRVLAAVDAQSVELAVEADGCFHGSLALKEPLEPGWHEVEFELLESRDGADTRSTGEVLVPPDDAEFGVICGLDGTVFPTGTTQRLRMARAVRAEHPRTQPAFSGFAAFNRALKLGRTGMQSNPVFYLTKSPWERYELCDAFLKVRDIPRGPLFMRDVEHDKRARIRHLLGLYPHLPFVLIGDSGQVDPELYAQVVEEHPGRIRAVYVCETSRRHRREVRTIAQRVREHDVPMLLAKNTTDAAAHALELGLIHPLFLRRPETSGGIRAP